MNPAPGKQGHLDPEAVDSAPGGNPEFESSPAAVQPSLPVPAGAASDPSARSASRLSVSVIIPAYTIDRWSLIVKAVESVRTQSVVPEEIVVCVDNNDKLLERARAEWSCAGTPPVRVMANRSSNRFNGSEAHALAHGKTRRGGGSARNCAVETVTSDIVAFLDDDAWAEPDWLERLLSVHEGFPVVAVGGPPLPDYETQRPAWFPSSFDWVFGCAYEGLPKSTGPLRHLFGGNMAVRRGSFMALNGFQSIDFDSRSKPAAARAPLDDLDLCMRLAHRFGADSLYYEPRAVVHHYVPAERLSWRYFYRRCYFVNRRKAQTLRDIGPAANLAAELEFVWRTITRCCLKDLRRGISGEPGAFRSLGATLIGIALAGLGHLRGRLARPMRANSSSNPLALDLSGHRNEDSPIPLEGGDI